MSGGGAGPSGSVRLDGNRDKGSHSFALVCRRQSKDIKAIHQEGDKRLWKYTNRAESRLNLEGGVD